MDHNIATAILGAADGVTSIAGVIAGGAGVGVLLSALAVTAIGGAFAATVSMAGAEFLSESKTDLRAIKNMALGTLLGSALPALPLLFLSGPAAWIGVFTISAVIGIVVGTVRAKTTGRSVIKSVLQTLLVLALGAAVGYGAGLIPIKSL